jgi:hypothetical protein
MIVSGGILITEHVQELAMAALRLYPQATTTSINKRW